MRPWLVTFPTYNSRFSERAAYYSKPARKPGSMEVILSNRQVEIVKRLLLDVSRKHCIPILSMTVQPDHVHMLILAQDKTDLSSKVKKLKGSSSYRYNRIHNMPDGSHLWARGYDYRLIKTDEHYFRAYWYIKTNDSHHIERWD